MLLDEDEDDADVVVDDGDDWIGVDVTGDEDGNDDCDDITLM